MPMHNPPHPGEIIRWDCLEPLGLTVTRAAQGPGVSRQALSSLVNGKADLSVDMALRLSHPALQRARSVGLRSYSSHSKTLISRRVSCYCHRMANLQIRNMPDTLHERLRRYARENNCTMRAVALSAIERELAHWEWRKRLAQRPETDLGVEAAALLMEERARRNSEIG